MTTLMSIHVKQYLNFSENLKLREIGIAINCTMFNTFKTNKRHKVNKSKVPVLIKVTFYYYVTVLV